jgi:hypothetical protein
LAREGDGAVACVHSNEKRPKKKERKNTSVTQDVYWPMSMGEPVGCLGKRGLHPAQVRIYVARKCPKKLIYVCCSEGWQTCSGGQGLICIAAAEVEDGGGEEKSDGKL